MAQVDYEEAKRSIRKIREADGDLSILSQSEYDNLVDLVDEFIESQGWDIEEIKLMSRQHEN